MVRVNEKKQNKFGEIGSNQLLESFKDQAEVFQCNTIASYSY